MPPVTYVEINKHKNLMLTMLESLNYNFRNPPKKHNLSKLPHQTVEKLQKKKKTMVSSEDPSLVNNVDELGLVY